jgi:hypothetical protein
MFLQRATQAQGYARRRSRDRARASDGRQFLDCGMHLGDVLIYRGRRVVLVGLEPMSVPDRRALVRDLATGEQLDVPLDELEPREGLPPTP